MLAARLIEIRAGQNTTRTQTVLSALLCRFLDKISADRLELRWHRGGHMMRFHAIIEPVEAYRRCEVERAGEQRGLL